MWCKPSLQPSGLEVVEHQRSRWNSLMNKYQQPLSIIPSGQNVRASAASESSEPANRGKRCFSIASVASTELWGVRILISFHQITSCLARSKSGISIMLQTFSMIKCRTSQSPDGSDQKKKTLILISAAVATNKVTHILIGSRMWRNFGRGMEIKQTSCNWTRV